MFYNNALVIILQYVVQYSALTTEAPYVQFLLVELVL